MTYGIHKTVPWHILGNFFTRCRPVRRWLNQHQNQLQNHVHARYRLHSYSQDTDTSTTISEWIKARCPEVEALKTFGLRVMLVLSFHWNTDTCTIFRTSALILGSWARCWKSMQMVYVSYSSKRMNISVCSTAIIFPREIEKHVHCAT